MCTHYGLRSWFRGLTPYLYRVVGLYSIMNLGDWVTKYLREESDKNRMSIEKEEGSKL